MNGIKEAIESREVKYGTVATLTLGIAAAMLFASIAGAEPKQGFCSQTADALYTACKASASDDSYVKKAVCINISDPAQREACQEEQASDRADSLQLCRDQHDWRLEACKLLGEGRYDPDFSPAHFESDFTRLAHPNSMFPLTIGNRWSYRGGNELDTVEVVNETKNIAGVTCIVLRDKVYRNGELAESTDDWYAQNVNKAVWYFGEETGEYESYEGDNPRLPELVNIDGSFKAGRDGAKPGIIFLGSPSKNDVYLEEFSLGNAEDATVVLSTNYAFGRTPELDQLVPRELASRLCSGNCTVTKNFSLLEPGIFARKYYAPGIGVFLEVEFNPDGNSVSQLVDCNFDARCHNLPNP